MLCTFCKKIKPHRQRPGKDRKREHACLVRHHTNFDDLINSANQGCELCKLFRPYVEYAQFKKKLSTVELVASPCGSNDGYSNCTEQSHDDLFDDNGYGEYRTVRASKYAGYYDYGYHWYWFDELSDGSVNSNARYRRIQMILEKEEEEDKLSGAAMVEQHPTVHNSEIMQWLFQQDGKPVGSEQVWIQGCFFTAEGWPVPTGDFAMMKQGEQSTVFSLSVGSVSPWVLGQNTSFCVDNQPVKSAVALEYQIPGIWQHKYNSARISRKWASTTRNMQPAFEFYHRREDLKDTAPLATARDVVENPSSNSCFEIARGWLSFCVSKHDRCRPSKGISPPTRLIDVGLSLSGKAHLRRTKSEERDLKYATLSHCWGADSSKISMLRKCNITSMLSEIDESELSVSFQDAIKITRALGIRYLWIDAPCIIQDSPSDWAHESEKMASYYKGGHVMISAFASPNANHGILRPRAVDHDSVEVPTDGINLFMRPILEDATCVLKPRHIRTSGQPSLFIH